MDDLPGPDLHGSSRVVPYTILFYDSQSRRIGAKTGLDEWNLPELFPLEAHVAEDDLIHDLDLEN